MARRRVSEYRKYLEGKRDCPAPIPYSTWRRWLKQGTITVRELLEMGIHPGDTRRKGGGRKKKEIRTRISSDLPVCTTSTESGFADQLAIEEDSTSTIPEEYQAEDSRDNLSITSSGFASTGSSNRSSSGGRSSLGSPNEVEGDFLNKNLEGMARRSNPSVAAQEQEAEKYKAKSRKYKESLHNAKRTISKREAEIKELRSKIQRLEETNKRILDLNIKYQTQMLNSPRPSDVTNAKSNAIVLEPESIIKQKKLDDKLTDAGIGGLVVRVADHPPSAHVNVGQERVVAATAATPQPHVKGLQELVVPPPAPTVPDADTIPAAHTETIEIYPGVYVNPAVYDEDFKNFLIDPKNMLRGQEHDADFVKDLAEVVFKPAVLAASTVKGTMTNARKSDPNYANVDPELCPIKRQAIERALYRRVSIEVEGLEQSAQNTVLKARVQFKLINKWLGKVIHNHKRKRKRAQKAVEKAQAQQRQNQE